MQKFKFNQAYTILFAKFFKMDVLFPEIKKI